MAIGDEYVVTAIYRGLVRIQPKSVDGIGFQRRHIGGLAKLCDGV